MTSLCEIITKLLADASLNMLGSNLDAVCEKGYERIHKMSMVAFLVSFLASTAGAICGIGGGVIIKPVLGICSRWPAYPR